MSRAQLKHVLLDVDFFDKPTIRALGYAHTQLSVLLFIRWMMLMSRATDGLVTRDSLASIAREVLHGVGASVASFETVLDYCLAEGMIHEESPGRFTNKRVIKDQESCAVKRQSASERQKKHRGKKTDIGNALVTRLPDTDTVIDTDIEFLNREGKQLILDFLWMDEIEIETWKVKLGTKGFDRACEKLNGWIGQAIGTPEYSKRLAQGKNAGFALQNWVAQSVHQETAPRAGSPPGRGQKSVAEISAELDERERRRNGDTIRN